MTATIVFGAAITPHPRWHLPPARQQETASDGTELLVDSDTLASLALANLTAVISFVLLAFSSIPALNAVGQVVAPGILLSLLLSAAFVPARKA